MASRPDLDTLPKITARSGVTNGTLDRIRRAVVSTRVDELEKLGKAFGIEAWELLRPRGHAALSPLALMLAAHLDGSLQDDALHAAAYAAATVVIDALAPKPGAPVVDDAVPEAAPPAPALAQKEGRAF